MILDDPPHLHLSDQQLFGELNEMRHKVKMIKKKEHKVNVSKLWNIVRELWSLTKGAL